MTYANTLVRPLPVLNHVRKDTAAAKDPLPDDKKPAGTLTQEEVNAIVARERKAIEKKHTDEINALRAEVQGFGELKTEFSEFKKLIEEAAGEVEEEERKKAAPKEDTGISEVDEYLQALEIPPGVKDKETFLRLKKRQITQDRQISELNERLKKQDSTLEELRTLATTEAEARKQAEVQRIEAIKERKIADALVKNNCIDIDTATLIYSRKVSFDAKTGQFVFTKADGEKVSVDQGIADELPAYLVKAAAQDGGAGSGGARAPSDNEITRLKKEMEMAAELAGKNPNNVRAVNDYQRAKRALNDAQMKKAK